MALTVLLRSKVQLFALGRQEAEFHDGLQDSWSQKYTYLFLITQKTII